MTSWVAGQNTQTQNSYSSQIDQAKIPEVLIVWYRFTQVQFTPVCLKPQ